MPPIGTSIYHIEIDDFEIFYQYLISPKTYFERERSGKRRARTLPNTKVGSCQIRLVQQLVLFPLETQAMVSEITLNLTIIKGSPDRPVVFCKN